MLPAANRFGRSERLWLAALLATVAAVFWRHLFTSDVLFLRDIANHHYPRAVELRNLVRSGIPPVWNPFEHFGEPVAVNANYLLFYPTAWLAWVLPPAYGFKLHYVLHFFLLAVGGFLLARRLGLKPSSCYVAGALYVFSGPVMSAGNFYNLLPAAAWIAPALLAADRLMRRPGWRSTVLLAAALALQAFAGEPLTSLMTGALALAWCLTFYGPVGQAFLPAPSDAGTLGAGKNACPTAPRIVLRLVAAAGLAAALSAPQLLPAIVHARHTARAAQLTYAHSFFWSWHPLRVLEVLLPEFWGNVLYHDTPWLYMDGREPLLLSLFIGILPLVLAAAAVLLSWNSAATKLWFWVAVCAAVLALGRFTPVSYLFYYVIPIFRVVRFPVKFLLPLALAVAQLAALGAERLLEPRPEGLGRRGRWLLWPAGAFACLWLMAAAAALLRPDAAMRLAALYFDPPWTAQLRPLLVTGHEATVSRAGQWLARAVPGAVPYVLACALLAAGMLSARLGERRRRAAVVVAAATAIVPLAAAHYGLNPLAGRNFFDDPPRAAGLLRTQQPPARIFAEPLRSREPTLVAADPLQVGHLPPAARGAYVQRLSLQIGAGLLGLEGTFSTDTEVILLTPQHQLNLLVTEIGILPEEVPRVLRAGSVEYALLRGRVDVPGLEYAGAARNGTLGGVHIYRVQDPLPRAYLVAAGRAMTVPLGKQTISRLLSPAFDPGTRVLLEQQLPDLPPAAPEAPPGEVRLLRREPLLVEAAVRAAAPAVLVLTDSYHPDWRVYVDGRRAPLLRANQVFRAVLLPAGEHRVTFRFVPVPLITGVLIGAGAILLALIAGWRRKRRGTSPPGDYDV